MAIDYSNFKASLKNLEIQHEHLLDLSPDYPLFVHEGMAESVIQRFENCYDVLWKTLRRYIVESLGIAEAPNGPRPIFRIASENRLLAAGAEQWELYVDTRIDTAHDYDGEKAAKAIEIIPEFIADAIELYSIITGETWA